MRAGRMEYYWICLWSVLGVGLCVTDDEHYTLHLNPLNFDKALEACLPDSFLTKVASMEEASKILKVITNMHSIEGTFEFWVGLRKGKWDCVKNDTSLNGFKWTVDSSSDTELDQWKSLPQPTCTGILCVFLYGEFNGTEIVNWGFVPSTCKTKHPFICKQRDGKILSMDQCPTPHIPEARSLRPNPNYPHKLELECWSGELFELTCSATTLTWKRDDRSAIDGICASCKAGYMRDGSGNCVDIDECRDQPCKDQCVNTEGSYLCKCRDKNGNLQDKGSVSCNELPVATVTPEGSETYLVQDHTPTPKPTIQERPIIIFLPDQPTPTSPTDDVETVDKSGEQDKIFIPVLIAVMALVVLVVVVLAIVKCCLRRRLQKLAMKNAEKMAMKRAEASTEKYSLENTNEKEAI
ncbi:C-type lectin domain family 14 member A [Coregonus clupeaformis]|uniref:C-type lectin domain family 14 member A n=1 Tax=Coregonus clupeaformis TaxID=59861 RepID=UPI001BE06324|nr:C-type lectin domain family 14 member A [Coregonus clupeaformis]